MSQNPTLCRFGAECYNMKCSFLHPPHRQKLKVRNHPPSHRNGQIRQSQSEQHRNSRMQAPENFHNLMQENVSYKINTHKPIDHHTNQVLQKIFQKINPQQFFQNAWRTNYEFQFASDDEDESQTSGQEPNSPRGKEPIQPRGKEPMSPRRRMTKKHEEVSSKKKIDKGKGEGKGEGFIPNRTAGDDGGQKIEGKIPIRFCRQYHLNNICQEGEKCSQLHSFSYNADKNIKRLHYFRNNNLQKTKMAALVYEDTIFYILKGFNSITMLKYEPEINKIQEQGSFNLDQTNCVYFKVFKHKEIEDSLLVIAYEGKTGFDIEVRNVSNPSLVTSFEKIHEKQVVGVAQLNQNTFLSISHDGDIKQWSVKDQKFKIDEERTGFYERALPMGFKKLLRFNCLEEIDRQGKKVVLIGTSFSKILKIQIGKTTFFDWIDVEVPDNRIIYSVKQIKHENRNQKDFIYALTCSSQSSYVLKREMEGQFFKIIFSKRFFRDYGVYKTFGIFDDLLAIGGATGIVLNNSNEENQRVGIIFHKSEVSTVEISEYQSESKEKKVWVMAVLQPKNEKVEGSGQFSLYTVQ